MIRSAIANMIGGEYNLGPLSINIKPLTTYFSETVALLSRRTHERYISDIITNINEIINNMRVVHETLVRLPECPDQYHKLQILYTCFEPTHSVQFHQKIYSYCC